MMLMETETNGVEEAPGWFRYEKKFVALTFSLRARKPPADTFS